MVQLHHPTVGVESPFSLINFDLSTATNPSPSLHIPVGLKFLFRNFESKI